MTAAVQPRGLRRAAAAAYLGISPSHFDKQRQAGAIPPPKPILGVEIYDRHDLDSLFDGKVMVADNDNNRAFWDTCFDTANPST